MRVKFSSVVASGHVNLSLVDETDNLDVCRRLKYLDTLKGASGNETCTVTRLRTPCNFQLLGITDSRVGIWGRPQAEVCITSKYIM